MAEVGSATVAIVPTFTGFRSKVGDEADGAGKESGSRFSGAFKAIAGPAMALAASGVFAGFIGEAARASDATDKFKATMNFAGLDSSAITEATNAAKEFADQTVYDLPTIQNTIAQLASNGVSDYTGLTKAAGNLNAVAGGNADTFKSVAMVMTQTAGAGKLTTENWNQMADAIPGAAGPLMKSLKEAGAYTGNFRDAMAAGEITSDEFNASLMKLGNDPVAVEAAKSTKTFEGAIGNLQATINSGLMSALDALKPAITGAITGVSNGIAFVFGKIGATVTGLKSLIMDGDITPTLLNALGLSEDSPIIGGLMWLQEKFWAAFRGIQNFIAGLSVPMPDIAGQLAGSLGGLFTFGLKAKEIVMKAYFGISDFILGFKLPRAEILPQEFAGLIEVGNNVRGVFDQIGGTIRSTFTAGAGGVRAFFAAFAAGDGDVTSSGFAGMMEQIGNAARKVFDAIGPAIGPLIPQIMSLWSSFSPLQVVFQAIQPLIPQLLGMFGQLAGVIGGTLVTALTTLAPMFAQLSALVSQTLGGVLAAVLPTIVQMITMLGSTLSSLLPVIMPIIATVIQLAMTLISQLAPIITNLVASILPPLVSIFGNILAAIGPLITTIAGVLIPVIQALMPVVVTIFGVIADVITSAMQIVQGIIEVVTGIITGNWSQVWTGISRIFSGIWDTIVSVVSGALQIVGSVVLAGLGLVFGFVGNVLGNIGRFFADTWNNITRGVGGFIDGFLRFFTDLPGKIVSALSGAGTWLLGIGKNIIDGLINGITGMAGTVAKAILNLVPEAIRGPIEAALGIHSPSRVAMWWGHMIGDGLSGGIDDSQRQVARSMGSLVSIPNVTGAVGSTVAGVGAGQVNNITINQVDDPIGTSTAVARRLRAVSV